jgi:hypothetical protein
VIGRYAKKGIRRVARELQIGVGTVLRIKAELAARADEIQRLSFGAWRCLHR